MKRVCAASRDNCGWAAVQTRRRSAPCATAFAIVAATGNIYSGLWYPIVIAAMSFVIGLIFLPETKDRDITRI